MTFHLKDMITLIGLISIAVGSYTTIKINNKRILDENKEMKKRMDNLEKKNDDLKEIFGNFKVEMAKMKFEIIEAVTKIFNGKK